MIDLSAMLMSLALALVLAVPLYLVIYRIVSGGQDAGYRRNGDAEVRGQLVRAALAREPMDTGDCGPRHLWA
jgi:hypothetical protein